MNMEEENMSEPDCLACKSKACKTKTADCFNLRGESLSVYPGQAEKETVKNSSVLVDNGRAGKLSRFQEVIEFCKLQGYKNVGIAYCFGPEEYALIGRNKMKAEGINIIPARCTMGGINYSINTAFLSDQN